MQLKRLQTEGSLHQSAGLDTWDDNRILDALVAGQERAVAAVRNAMPALANAATIVAARLEAGSRLVYAGAGASMRNAVQDGAELPATFGVPEDHILYCIAGGRAAVFETMADAEDDEMAGARDGAALKPGDVVIGVAASGATPYTLAVVRAAKARGASIIALVNNPSSPLGAIADVEVLLASGPEVIAGSTRMGAGTAQKAALNLISTLANIRLGAVHDGLMVNVQAGNGKLRQRAHAIVMQIAGVDEARAGEALANAAGEVKTAVLICAGVRSPAEARSLLAAAKGRLRTALAKVKKFDAA